MDDFRHAMPLVSGSDADALRNEFGLHEIRGGSAGSFVFSPSRITPVVS